jgi:hypothetical protein
MIRRAVLAAVLAAGAVSCGVRAQDEPDILRSPSVPTATPSSTEEPTTTEGPTATNGPTATEGSTATEGPTATAPSGSSPTANATVRWRSSR